MSSAVSRLSCFCTIRNRFHLDTRSQHHLLRSKLLTVMNNDQLAIKASSTDGKSALRFTANASKADNDTLEKPYTNREEYLDREEIGEPVQHAVTEPKRAEKIHDFCFGIPYGGIVFSRGLLGFLFLRNPATLISGGLYGGSSLALSIFSLKIWSQGHSSLPFMLGQAVDDSELEGDKLHDDIKAAEKHTALHSALSQLAGDFDGESMLFLQRFFGARVKPVVSTGSLKLDLALGIGGLPKGRIVEIYGHEASGKTTLALNVIKEAQKLGGYCAYLDVENALDPLLLESIGVNTKSLLISQPNSAENLLSIVDTLAKSGAVDVIVVDSVAALIPQREIKSVISDNVVEMQSQIMTQALRKIHFSLCRSETLIIFINQVRSNLKSHQEGLRNVNEVTCGGNGLPFYSAVRMRIARKGLLKTRKKVTGLGICVEVIKNKLAPAMKKAELEIQFGRGISCASEILELACEHRVVLKEGNCYFIYGQVLNSKMEAEIYLIQNERIRDKLVKTLRKQLFDDDGRMDDDSES